MRRRTAIGDVRGDLVVLARAGTRGQYVMWQCRCVCGSEQAVDPRALSRGRFAACACPGRQTRRGPPVVWQPGPEPVAAPARRRKPLEVPLHTMIRIGRELGLTPEQAIDADRVSRAVRRDDPSHPGYVEAGRRLVGLGHGRTVP